MGKATTTAVTYETEAIRNAREYAGDAARRVKELEARVAELKAQLTALQRDALQETSADDLVKRLQHLGDWQAADRIEAQAARIAELRQIIRYVAGCEHATASDEDLLEQVATAICRMNGIDPTGHISINGSAFDWAWRHFLPQARAALGGKDELP